MSDEAEPTEVNRNIVFSPQAAAAYSKLGNREIVELDTGPNPMACPVCGEIGTNWKRDPESPDRILCKNDGTHIMTFVEDDDPPIEGAFRVEFPPHD